MFNSIKHLIKNNSKTQQSMKKTCLNCKLSFSITFLVIFIFFIKNVRCCGSRQFNCDNNQCIPIKWHCDGEKDCKDGSDENNCKITFCTLDQFECANQKCISSSRICDDVDDCLDGSDEINCDRHTCTQKQFSCGHNQKCISFAYKCDGKLDCPNGSDEEELLCATNCTSFEFKCKSNSQCISHLWKCDGEADCKDGSDEIGCSKSCFDDQFNCGNGQCIPSRWKCNGKLDCKNELDEKDCDQNKLYKCLKNEWLCDDQLTCINLDYRCNLIQDCPDGSDEVNCSSLISCSSTKFKCNNGNCIDQNKVCNGQDDCGDKSDESKICQVQNCNNETFNYCSHFCVNGHCSCKENFKLDFNNRSCIDVNECLELINPCSGHKCINLIGGYECECFDGYELANEERKYGKKCRVKGNEKPFLIFSSYQGIRKVELSNNRSYINYDFLIYKNHDSVSYLDFNFKENYLIWSDHVQNALYIGLLHLNQTSKYTKKKPSILITENIISIGGIAVDWIHNLIYWTDNIKKNIELVQLPNIDNRASIIDKNLDGPTSIVVDVSQSLLFFFDCGHSKHKKCKIMRIGQDGLNRKLLVNQNIRNPTGLAIHFVTKKLFWFEPDFHSLFSVKYNGQDKKQLLSKEYIPFPFAADVFEDFIFYSNFDLNAIIRLDLNHFYTNSIVHAATVRSIKVVHSVKQPILDNQCLNSLCSHICVPTSAFNDSKSYRCLCRYGYELSKNKHSCVIKHAFSKTIFTFFQDVLSSKLTTTKPSLFLNESYYYKGNLIHDYQKNHNSRGLNYAVVSNAHLALIIIAVFLTIGIIILILFLILYRVYQRRSFTSINFDNQIYRKATEN